MHDKQKGNTLIELLIASLVITLVLTGVAVSLMYSLKNEALDRYKQRAVDMASSGLEFLNFKRAELGWNGFLAAYGPIDPSGQKVYCGAGLVELPSGDCVFGTPAHVIQDNKLGINYLRQIVITQATDADTGIVKLLVSITMSWQPDEKDDRVYELNHEFSKQDY